MMLEPFLLLLAGLIAALLGLLLSWIARRLERIRAAAGPSPAEEVAAAGVAERVARSPRWPGVAASRRGATPSPADAASRARRSPLGNRADLRRAIVLATILGPPSGDAGATGQAGRITRERWW